uniref:Protein Wnt n=1 Tax=Phallusia mammillata TaxID=59560 RepID=A0A6F9DWG5_9ASCI|nr:Orphan Wnt e [Phallusia mammillata]
MSRAKSQPLPADIYSRITERTSLDDMSRAKQICCQRGSQLSDTVAAATKLRSQSVTPQSSRGSFPATYCRKRRAIEDRTARRGVDAIISTDSDKYSNITTTWDSTERLATDQFSSSTDLVLEPSIPRSFELSKFSTISRQQLESTKRLHRRAIKQGMTSSPTSSVTRIRAGNCGWHWFSMAVMLVLLCLNGVSAMWWSPGSDSKLIDTRRLCQWARRNGGEAARMCRKESNTINEIRHGIDRGLRSCSEDLRHDRWNCSQAKKVYFGNVMRKDLRETAYVQALTAAAVTYQITLACTKGRLNCGCSEIARQQRRSILLMEAEKRRRTVDVDSLDELVEEFEWGACGDNIEFGSLKAMEFMDIQRRKVEAAKGNITEAVYVHNFEAGQMTIVDNMRNKCQCHGLSGSCTLWTCWPIMPRFVEVRQRIRHKYDYAIRVQASADGTSLVPRMRSRPRFPRHSLATNRIQGFGFNQARHRATNKLVRGNRVRTVERKRRAARVIRPNDLIFLQSSPRFCAPNKSKGSLGTLGRRCDPTLTGLGSCSYLCCGRGYREEVHTFTEKCNCQFVYCCELKCDDCVRHEKRYYCL